MTADAPTPKPGPLDLLDGSFGRVAEIQTRPAEPPGNEWNFALGVLLALTTTGQLDDVTAHEYEERIQAEAERLRAL